MHFYDENFLKIKLAFNSKEFMGLYNVLEEIPEGGPKITNNFFYWDEYVYVFLAHLAKLPGLCPIALKHTNGVGDFVTNPIQQNLIKQKYLTVNNLKNDILEKSAEFWVNSKYVGPRTLLLVSHKGEGKVNLLKDYDGLYASYLGGLANLMDNYGDPEKTSRSVMNDGFRIFFLNIVG